MTAAKVEDASTWRSRVEGLEASGQSCRQYAKRIGVNPNTLAGWRWKLRRQRSAGSSTKAPAASGCDFVEVTRQVAAALTKESGVIEVELGGAIVRVRGDVDGETLARVLSAVGGRR